MPSPRGTIALVFAAIVMLALQSRNLWIYRLMDIEEGPIESHQRSPEWMNLRREGRFLGGQEQLDSLQYKLLESNEEMKPLEQKVANLRSVLNHQQEQEEKKESQTVGASPGAARHEAGSRDQQNTTVITSIEVEQTSEWINMSLAALNATVEKPFVAETHYHNGTLPIQALFTGPGRPEFRKNRDRIRGDESRLVFPNQKSREAVCQLSDIQHFHVFPHNFQQLLRCFSWWQLDQNKNKAPVLYIQQYNHSNGRTESIHDMYKAMHEVFGVRLDIEKRANTDSPEVHVDAPWRAMDVQTKTYAMVSPDHAKTLVEGLLNHYTPNNDKRAGCPADGKSKKSKPVMAFLDRKDSKRSISNGPEVLDKLRQSGHDIRYQPSFHGMSLIEQIKFMSEADIVMGPHGTQFTSSLFMPWCGSLLKFFPRQYYAPNWYGSMVALSGKHHFLTYQGGQALNAYRRNTRHFNASVEAVEQVTAVMVERWHSCRAARNSNNCNSNKFGNCTIVEEKRGGKMSIPPEAIDGTEQNPYVAETRYNGTLPAWEMFLGPDVPHNFQQLVRCFSWWQMDHNKNKTPVLYIQQYDHGTDDMASVHGMYKAMQDAFGVRLDIGNRTNEDSPEVHVMAPWETMAT
ncbi:unknown protein [Seminavis robusta]|uniref:Glycosyltransferase 61 catalytic domain-containing protein n=1 Tax=Seminavis robusta TaxID=568900 RepID=A0A9N8EZE4_9STRA|nr:unknown protein [Seminavis robusta]|eukprot:Sro2309_g322780.1 n/a (628) ;mRNA; r:2199-4294